MRAELAAPGDASREDHEVRYRLFVYQGLANETTAYDLTECTVLEALEAGSEISGRDARLWSLAQCVDAERTAPVLGGAVMTVRSRGLIWLSGHDYTDGEPTSAAEWRLRAEMQDRYLMARSLAGDPVVLPDGRRVFRMFPGWSTVPLWESFSEDNYPFGVDSIPVSVSLRDELIDWSEHWAARALGESDLEDEGNSAGAGGDGTVESGGKVTQHEAGADASWAAWGARLYRRAVGELGDIAEVRPEFELPEE